MLARAHGDHWLNREDHARFHDRGHAGFVIVRDLKIGVELLSDSVANKCAHNFVAVGDGMRFNCSADVRERTAGRNSGDAAIKALASDFDETLRRVIDIADAIGGIGVAVHAVEPDGDVEIHDVSIAQRPVIGDAVTNNFVYRCAERFRIAPVIERARVTAAIDIGLMHNCVDFVGGHARGDSGSANVEDFGGSVAGSTHALDEGSVFDALLRTTSDVPGLGVLGAGDLSRNGAHGADEPRLELFLRVAVAALEFLPTATPTRIVCLQHGTSLRAGWTGATGSGRQP
ncbi:unannotated protein [freshwater metagenome]|uniref:Unannotated protein n=1 Tax=freshwater metagenome TaxID=449393 RepID=A0A6J6F0J7_9ZZZZ